MENANALTPKRHCVLVVEDDAHMRKVIVRMLGNLGYHVLTAENGRQGLDIFMENMAAIDLVLIDLVMPVMDGTTMVRSMLSQKPDLNIAVSSGSASSVDDSEFESLKRLGVKAFIPKPFSPDELRATVKSLLPEIEASQA